MFPVIFTSIFGLSMLILLLISTLGIFSFISIFGFFPLNLISGIFISDTLISLLFEFFKVMSLLSDSFKSISFGINFC